MNINLELLTNKIADLEEVEREMIHEIMEHGDGYFTHDVGFVQGKKEALVEVLRGYYEGD